MRPVIRQILQQSKPLLLDRVSVIAVSAYSLRRLSKKYKGSVIRIARSSDNQEIDIGFDRMGNLDTGKILSFASTDTARITTQYDQTNNGLHLTQPNPSKQPTIATAGVVKIRNNRPAVYYYRNSNMYTINFTAYQQGITFAGVAGINANGGYEENNAIWGKSRINYPSPIDCYGEYFLMGKRGSFVRRTLATPIREDAGYSAWSFSANPNLMTSYRNGVTNLTNDTETFPPEFYADEGQAIRIGDRQDGFASLDGWMTELITYNAVLSTEDRQRIEQSQSKYYNIPLS